MYTIRVSIIFLIPNILTIKIISQCYSFHYYLTNFVWPTQTPISCQFCADTRHLFSNCWWALLCTIPWERLKMLFRHWKASWLISGKWSRTCVLRTYHKSLGNVICDLLWRNREEVASDIWLFSDLQTNSVCYIHDCISISKPWIFLG